METPNIAPLFRHWTSAGQASARDHPDSKGTSLVGYICLYIYIYTHTHIHIYTEYMYIYKFMCIYIYCTPY